MVVSDLPQVEGAQLALITGSAVAELQELLERCADFEVMVTGSPPDAHAAADLLVEIPPDHALRDKLVIGVWTDQGLTAAIDLLRDFPDPRAGSSRMAQSGSFSSPKSPPSTRGWQFLLPLRCVARKSSKQ